MSDVHKSSSCAGAGSGPINQAGVFSTTHWSVVLEACKGGSPDASKALEQLCLTYWYPLYAFVRRRGHDPHEAEDLTQAFFGDLLEREALKTVVPAKGQFRSFLLAAVTNFLNNEWDKSQTQKRGGQYRIISLNEVTPEELYRCEPVQDVPPEKLFERRWAMVLVDQVLCQLKKEYEGGGKLELFQMLQSCLTSEATPGFIATAAQSLKMSEGAVKVALHRLRRGFGEALREQVACTVSSAEQVDEEIRQLLAAISGE